MLFGVPNVISKSESKKIAKIQGVNNVYVVMDLHTVLHTSSFISLNLEKIYDAEKIRSFFSIRDNEIPITLKEELNKESEEVNKRKLA